MAPGTVPQPGQKIYVLSEDGRSYRHMLCAGAACRYVYALPWTGECDIGSLLRRAAEAKRPAGIEVFPAARAYADLGELERDIRRKLLLDAKPFEPYEAYAIRRRPGGEPDGIDRVRVEGADPEADLARAKPDGGAFDRAYRYSDLYPSLNLAVDALAVEILRMNGVTGAMGDD